MANAVDRQPATAAWCRLASFSDAVLNGLPGELTARELRTVALRYASEAEGLTIARSVESVLNRAYGLDKSEAARSCFHVMRAKLSDQQLGRGLGAHLAVAVLAAYGVTYRQALQETERQRGTEDGRPSRLNWKQTHVLSRTLDEAKKAAKSHVLKAQYPSSLKDRLPYVYWTLRLKAERWLESLLKRRFGKKSYRVPAIPSVESDRAAIMANSSSLALIRQARPRASVRDSDWLASWGVRKRSAPDVIGPFATRLALEREAHFALNGRPTKWTARIASERLRIPYQTVITRAMRDKRVRKLVPETAADFFRRLTRWGIEQCLHGDHPLTVPDVVKVTSTWKKEAAVRQEIEEYKRKQHN